MESSFYYYNYHVEVSQNIKKYLNSVPDYLSAETSRSVRATGDAIEKLISDKLDKFLENWCEEYFKNFNRRSMEDIAFKDKEGFYHAIDIKTCRRDTNFNRPNLTSVERLSRFYENNKNIYSIILVKYEIHNNKVTVLDVIFAPIENINWACLTIGNLGWGQIQINSEVSIKEWMLSFFNNIFCYYNKEKIKIDERISRFNQIRKSW